jgi:prepilin-type N-terminal cleavage/methylation domain-containing protein
MRCQPIVALGWRRAFTLIELLVVIALIVVITAIGILTIPLLQSQQKATKNASQVAAWLGNAKAIALRDQRPTGLRFVPDPANPSFVREMYLIQTPEDFTGGTVTVPAVPTNVLVITGANFFGGFGPANVLDHPVQVGDYFEINGGGLLYRIEQVGPANNRLVLSRNIDASAAGNGIAYKTQKYRIIRQPRRIVGEEALTLTGDVAIDLGTPPNTLSQNVPVRAVPDNPPQYYEILFAPNGGVVGKGTVASDKIILWVRDTTRPNVTDNDPVLIGIQVRTGFIGTYQVDQTSNDPYSFARDPRAGGM